TRREILMVKHLVLCRLTRQHDTHCGQSSPRLPGRCSSLNTYQPLVEVLEDRTLLSFLPPVNYAAGAHPTFVAVGDFNGDGTPDLVVANYGSYFSPGDTVSVLLSNGDGSFQSAGTFPAGSRPSSVAVGDFDGDGHLDLAVANEANDTVSVLLGNGDGTFQTARNFPVGIRPQSVAVGDFDGDGHLDLAVANY